MRLHKKIFILKIDLPALLAFAFFAGLIFFYLIPGFEKVMMDRKRNLIHEITSSAYSLLEHFHSLEISGKLNEEEAKEQAKTAISTIRYGETLKDYFWITDQYPRMIIHPYRPELNGADLTLFRDSNGKTIFVEFADAVSATGESYVDYMWQWNDDSTRNVPKLSYVKLFEPWGWIVGTGIYIEDVKSEIQRFELRAMIISGIIGIMIIILLILISRQSHKIEQKRNKAEEELQKSRELYRTLAEASSEGVLIWSVLGIQANKILLSWLGYSEKELKDTPFDKIFSSEELSDIKEPLAFYEELNSRRYVESFIRTKNGNPIKSHAEFSRIVMGDIKSVLVVIRPISSTPATSLTPAARLYEGIGTGFFRLTYGKKSRFLYASGRVVEIFGFDNYNELTSHTFESLFTDPVELAGFRKKLDSEETITAAKYLLKQKSGNTFRAVISLVLNESESGGTWYEGTIEYLAASSLQNNSAFTDLNVFGASYILSSPVTSIMSPPLSCNENLTVTEALEIMKEKNSRFIIVTGKDGGSLGVADAVKTGIRLAEGGSPDTEIFRWMDSPPSIISDSSEIQKSFEIIGNNNKKCLLVTNNQNVTTGIITADDLAKAFFRTPGLINSDIENATSAADLKIAFTNIRMIAVSMILGRADPYSVSQYISSAADSICRKTVALCIEESGIPPCSFAFIQTGSAGRGEQTLSTDQDNAIIFEDCDGEKLRQSSDYFLQLGKKINLQLAEAGFRLCKGDNMAGNPRWCQPVSVWKKYFSSWIKNPGPNELLEVSIFFDFRFCSGDPGLAEELGEYVRKGLKTNDIFFHHMAAAWKPFTPSLHNTSDGKTDLKRILMPLTGIIRLYSLRYAISGFSTIERIIQLHSGNHIDEQLLRDTIQAWNELTSIRLSHQASCINRDAEPDNIVDFSLTESDKIFFTGHAIKTVTDLMLKAGSDYYTDIL
jgi:PAS domain S-box-containing protein